MLYDNGNVRTRLTKTFYIKMLSWSTSLMHISGHGQKRGLLQFASLRKFCEKDDENQKLGNILEVDGKFSTQGAEQHSFKKFKVALDSFS